MRRLQFFASLVVLVASACTPTAVPSSSNAAPGPSGPPASAAPSGGGGGTLVVAIAADPGHLNPAITTSGATHTAAELLYNGLVGLDENLAPIPELAESWKVEENGAKYTFTLREGVVWHDGTPFTSADVKFTFEEILLKLHARTRSSVAPPSRASTPRSRERWSSGSSSRTPHSSSSWM